MAAQVNTHWRQVLYAEIGQRVQKIRNDRKLSVRTVATKLGVTYSAVSKVEEGAGAPTHFLVGFAQLTGCTMDSRQASLSLGTRSRAPPCAWRRMEIAS